MNEFVIINSSGRLFQRRDPKSREPVGTGGHREAEKMHFCIPGVFHAINYVKNVSSEIYVE